MENNLTEEQKKSDKYLNENIEKAKTDFDSACDLYRSYVGTAETPKERLRRITLFRCGGSY